MTMILTNSGNSSSMKSGPMKQIMLKNMLWISTVRFSLCTYKSSVYLFFC